MDTCDSQSKVIPVQQQKSTNFNVRLDVVRKTIFRAMKKYYVNEFKNFFDYTQRKRKPSVDHCQEVIDQAKKYLIGSFAGNQYEDMYLFLVALIDTKQKYSESNSKFPELGTQINGLLRSFNTKKAKALLKFKEFSMLLLNFLNKEENITDLLKGKSEQECIQTYQTQIAHLKEQASSTLAAVTQ